MMCVSSRHPISDKDPLLCRLLLAQDGQCSCRILTMVFVIPLRAAHTLSHTIVCFLRHVLPPRRGRRHVEGEESYAECKKDPSKMNLLRTLSAENVLLLELTGPGQMFPFALACLARRTCPPHTPQLKPGGCKYPNAEIQSQGNQLVRFPLPNNTNKYPPVPRPHLPSTPPPGINPNERSLFYLLNHSCYRHVHSSTQLLKAFNLPSRSICFATITP
jgi:hypothetical protein